MDSTTFVAESARQFHVPVDTECAFAIEYLAVPPHRIAADIYVNGTLIRRVRAGEEEYGVFKVTQDGRIY